jgi:deoxyribonuclease IV
MLFGAHVSVSGGISSAVDRGVEAGCDAIQVFTQSPRMWRHTAHSAAELARFRARRAETEIGSVVCHALYLVNLASPDRTIRAKSLTALEATLATATAIEADGVIFHVGSHLGSGFTSACRRVVPAMRRLLELTSERTWLLMENSAGAGGTIGRSLDELEVLFERLDGHPRLGICLDSCHWWVSGVDVTDPATLAGAIDDIESRVGLDRLRALHVNDAAAPLGSNRDRHASIGEGEMGEGLGVFLIHPAFRKLPAILETAAPGTRWPDAAELERFRQLHRRSSADARHARPRRAARGAPPTMRP